jgi:tetratricopeptide (TPR) repeat protein
MPETTVLHIQTDDSPATRVLELPGISVRIGRGAQCEVRLSEPRLAEVQCLLRRRGDTWHVQPVGPAGKVLLEGRPVDVQRALPMGVPLRVGEHWLTLRPADEGLDDGPGSFHAPIPVRGEVEEEHVEIVSPPAHQPIAASPLPELPPPRPTAEEAVSPPAHQPIAASPLPELPPTQPTAEVERDQLKRGQEHLDHPTRWLRARQTRSKSAGASLPPQPVSSSAPLANPVAPPEPPAPPVAPPPPAPTFVEERQRAWQPPKMPRSAAPRTAEPYIAPSVPRASVVPAQAVVPAPAPTEARSEIEAVTCAPSWRAKKNRQPVGGIERGEASLEASRSAFEAATDLISAEPPRAPISTPISTTQTARHERIPGGDREREAPPAPRPQAWRELRARKSRPQGAPREVPLETGPYVKSRVAEAPPAHTVVPRVAEVQARPGRSLVQPAAPARPPRQSPAPTRKDVDRPEEPAPEGTLPAAPKEPNIRNPFVRHCSLPRRTERDTGPTRVDETRPAPAATPKSRDAGPPETQNLPAPLAGAPADPGPEWPSARAILAAHPPRAASPTRKHKANVSRTSARPQPTVAREPEQWTLPFWPAWISSTAIALLFGIFGLALACTWAEDDSSAGLLANRALSNSSRARAPETGTADPDIQPSASWWRSTAGHLYLAAVDNARSGADPVRADQAQFLLHAARNASPLQASVRLANAQSSEHETPVRELTECLGQSRDVVSLELEGRCLLQAGKTGAALRAFRDALDLAARAELADLEPPVFIDDAQVRRYQLPYEELMGPVMRAMAQHRGWAFSEWSSALPSFAVAPLVAARALREEGRNEDAETALDLVLTQAQQPPPPGCSAAVHAAAGAEALALRNRWVEAEERYREAIPLLPHDAFRRSLWINLADIYIRLNDETKKRAAWEAAKGPNANEEITRRATLYQTQAGLRMGGAASRGAGPDSASAPDRFPPRSPP